MSGALAGTGALARLALRRDRVRLAVWLVATVGLVLAQAGSIVGLYPTRADLVEAASTVTGNPALVAMSGPTRALDTLGGRVTWEIAMFAAVVVSLMNIFTVTRHTRAEEESGHAELLRSTVVGRHAAAASTLAVVALADVVLAAGVALGLTSVGVPAGGSWALGAGLGATGLTFAAVALVAAQATENTRAASGAAGAVLGASFALRAAGDVGSGALSWPSPLAWPQAMHPFAGERWWVLGLAAAAVAVLLAVAFALQSRRDFGAGLVAPRPGPARAGARLASPLGLAARLQRGGLAGWSAGLFLGGVAYGSIADDIEDVVGDDETIRELLAQGGGSLTDAFFATTLLVLAVIAGGYALSSTLRMRGEEVAGRAEPVLATAVGRGRWAGSHLVMALAGTVVVVAAGGLGTGVAYGIAVGDAGQVPRLVGAALAFVPAVWVLVGLGTLLYGFVPRATAAGWGALAACAVVAFLGQLLDLPAWVVDLSPFQHVPQVTVSGLAAGPVLALTAVAAGLLAGGLAGFRRRDIG